MSPRPQRGQTVPALHGKAQPAANPTRVLKADQLAPRQLRAVDALLQGAMVKDVAGELGVSPEQVSVWRRSPVFQAEVDRRRDQLFGCVPIARALGSALEFLEESVADERLPFSKRLQAARELTKLGGKGLALGVKTSIEGGAAEPLPAILDTETTAMKITSPIDEMKAKILEGVRDASGDELMALGKRFLALDLFNEAADLGERVKLATALGIVKAADPGPNKADVELEKHFERLLALADDPPPTSCTEHAGDPQIG